jgi:excinuclease ABC subunit C
MFLSGKYTDLLTNLQADMHQAAGKKDFERAAELRDQIEALSNVIYGSKIDVTEPLKQLKDLLKLKKIPERIEAFDISNIGPAASVGSMVSFDKGVPDKNNYRRFKIRTVAGIDDFKMMAEIVRRRYSRLLVEKSPLPDLVIIDGGKGQLSAARRELEQLRAKIPIMGIAKKEEHIFVPFRADPIILAKTSKILHLIQKIRDEAHRFAISYHRLRRKKDTFY